MFVSLDFYTHILIDIGPIYCNVYPYFQSVINQAELKYISLMTSEPHALVKVGQKVSA